MANSSDPEIYGKIAGTFLLARLNVKGIFARAVVWVSSFSEQDGAKGIIVNKPIGRLLGECSPVFTGTPLARVPMFLGGPLEEHRLSVLACTHNFIKEETEIQVGLPPDKIRDLAQNPATRLMAFAGIAAWAPKQLEDELAAGTWLPAGMNFALWRSVPAKTLWEKLLEQSKKIDAQFMLRSPRNLEAN